MKKLAWLFAALSICTFTFVACDDDDNDDNKGGSTVAQDDKAKEGEACDANKKCAEGLLCGAKNTCQKAVTDVQEDDTCVVSVDLPVCEHKDGKTFAYKCVGGKFAKEECKADCKEGVGCEEDDGNRECLTHEDCAKIDETKPYCGNDYRCTDEKPAEEEEEE